MTKEQNEKLEQALKENLEKVRMAGMLAGAKGVAGAILEMCKEKEESDLIVSKVKDFCEISLGLKEDKNRK